MEIELLDSDIAKEFLTILSNYDDEMLLNIPDEFMKRLSNIAADSDKDFHLDNSKSLMDQNISTECKSLIAATYYLYNTNSSEQGEILKSWLLNDNKTSNNE